MPTITKRDLARILSERMPLEKALAYQCADVFFSAMTESITQGNRIEARGFGVFEVKATRAKTGRNPKTGERVAVPARRKVLFKPGKALREVLGRPREEGEASS